MFEFTNLRILHRDMKNKSEERAVFPFQYNNKDFSCIFLTDIIPYQLYLTTLGANPIVFEFEIDNNYNVSCYIDSYNALVRYLELKYDPSHTFKPSDFFDALNRRIPTVFQHRPNYRDVLSIASKKKNIDEADKLYFCGWKNHNINHVSPENLEKTRIAFGSETANMCERKNISSCWTDIANKETLYKLNNLINM